MLLEIKDMEFKYCIGRKKHHLCPSCMRNIFRYNTLKLEANKEKLPNWILGEERGERKMCIHFLFKIKEKNNGK